MHVHTPHTSLFSHFLLFTSNNVVGKNFGSFVHTGTSHDGPTLDLERDHVELGV